MSESAEVVLFADDNPDDRFLFLQAFREAGIDRELVEFSDGCEVVDFLQRHLDGLEPRVPCLAILDLKMPRRTGLETLEWIRLSQRWSCLPVIIASASLDPGDARSSYQAGANAFVVKPSTVEELIGLAASIRDFWLRRCRLPA